jgi:hypothetical protein
MVGVLERNERNRMSRYRCVIQSSNSDAQRRDRRIRRALGRELRTTITGSTVGDENGNTQMQTHSACPKGKAADMGQKVADRIDENLARRPADWSRRLTHFAKRADTLPGGEESLTRRMRRQTQ